ncbi:hypothetical protein K504DRAFT_206294 [Pleomassaria siparia CBS 279.74]|uniref:Uncharacterized protein n=1 Tax=Pleomassaria siparia CBS 279.74 TaxID=1314801 RepID=A0A6G1KI71_9PLEO|nr:hypothetical protein K504DRAFT_206294 [Pleomassaria siparia CBS 279.74]
MAEKTCHYDCSSYPDKLGPYPDISDIGVFLGYSITAGLAVVIVIGCFLIAYRPDEDPFATKSGVQSNSNFQPNPTDRAIVQRLQPILPSLGLSRQDDHPLHRDMTKAMLTMSDIQLLAGLSILISGFTQIRCGLSAYHWQKLVPSLVCKHHTPLLLDLSSKLSMQTASRARVADLYDGSHGCHVNRGHNSHPLFRF